MDQHSIILQGVNLLDIVSFVSKKNKKYQAVALNEMENILLDKPELYEQVRKVYLDSSNNFARTILKAIFGDIEQSGIDKLVK